MGCAGRTSNPAMPPTKCRVNIWAFTIATTPRASSTWTGGSQLAVCGVRGVLHNGVEVAGRPVELDDLVHVADPPPPRPVVQAEMILPSQPPLAHPASQHEGAPGEMVPGLTG